MLHERFAQSLTLQLNQEVGVSYLFRFQLFLRSAQFIEAGQFFRLVSGLAFFCGFTQCLVLPHDLTNAIWR